MDGERIIGTGYIKGESDDQRFSRPLGVFTTILHLGVFATIFPLLDDGRENSVTGFRDQKIWGFSRPNPLERRHGQECKQCVEL